MIERLTFSKDFHMIHTCEGFEMNSVCSCEPMWPCLACLLPRHISIHLGPYLPCLSAWLTACHLLACVASLLPASGCTCLPASLSASHSLACWSVCPPASLSTCRLLRGQMRAHKY